MWSKPSPSTSLHRPLAHLDVLHPRAGHVSQRIREAGTTQVGHVLGEHLHVGATQPQQLDLSGAGGRITVGDIHRRIGGKLLAQVAAGGTYQFALSDGLGMGHPQS